MLAHFFKTQNDATKTSIRKRHLICGTLSIWIHLIRAVYNVFSQPFLFTSASTSALLYLLEVGQRSIFQSDEVNKFSMSEVTW